MSCNKPLIAYQEHKRNSRGSRAITFTPSGDTHPIALPCGQCMGCRIDKARSWAMRLHLESLSHLQTCFVTLTYSEENIPHGNTLIPEDLSRFIRALRKRNSGTRIRFYGVGEYGDISDRPHYHVILFGYDFPDRRIYKHRDSYTIDNSSILETLWKYGHSTVQDAAIETHAYVSKYAVKKITGKKAEEYYQRVDTETGEIYQLQPEFARMSRNPGIGHAWLEKYYKDLYPKGYVTDGKGKKFPPPEYFNKLYAKWFPEEAEKLRDERRQDVFDRYVEADVNRMNDREAIQTAQQNLKRKPI